MMATSEKSTKMAFYVMSTPVTIEHRECIEMHFARCSQPMKLNEPHASRSPYFLKYMENCKMFSQITQQ